MRTSISTTPDLRSLHQDWRSAADAFQAENRRYAQDPRSRAALDAAYGRKERLWAAYTAAEFEARSARRIQSRANAASVDRSLYL